MKKWNDKKAASYDSGSTTITEENEKCRYEWDVYTKYACVSSSGSGSSSGDDGEVSPGTILIIVVICAIVLYCIAGYIWNVKRSEDGDWKDVKSHTPHLFSFWCLIPKWTWAGCCVSKEWAVNKYQSYRGGGGGGDSGDAELIASTSEDDEI